MTDINFRHYTSISGITDDYFKVRDFLVYCGYCSFTYARFDWMITHLNLEKESLSRIGLWERGERVVGIAIFDCQPGETYLVVIPGFEFLYPEMIDYARRELNTNEHFSLVVQDNDFDLKSSVIKAGFVATPEKEFDAAMLNDSTYFAPNLNYELPLGFHITDMKERFDLYEYGRVLWKGFNHELNGEGEYAPSAEDEREGKASMLRANVDLSLKLAVVAPDGHFAAYCGMWHDEIARFSVIEPVACDPAYRLMGLARAAVLEGIKRTFSRGAVMAVVGSSQQFYYSIGMIPYTTATKWIPRIPS